MLIVDCKNRTPPQVEGSDKFAHVVGTPDILDGRIILHSTKMVNQETFNIWTTRAVPRENDIILTREAPVGRVGRVESNMKICLGQRTMLLRPDPDVVDSRFLHYFLLGPQVQGVLHARASGSTVPHLRVAQVRELPIPAIPSLSEQRKIGKMLGALDDKIALNGRIMLTSRELALAYWQRAGESGDLQAVSLGEAAKWLSGGTPRTSEEAYWNGEIPWISAASLKSPWIDDSERKVTVLGAENGTRMVPANTVIFVVRGMSLKTEFRIGITQQEVAFGQDCKALIARNDIDPMLLFFAIIDRTDEILGMVDEAGHGTGRLATDRLSRLEIHFPVGRAREELSKKLNALASLAAARQRENRTLAELRNTLLPKLISGEIHIKDAEKEVENVV
ncbi:restriction endonuclease subunit S [Streptosporangium sp. NPDC000396]|uniref:restriction endonuclease subunit S n=1 Tax=Streptosporangium sp. NPDC000396 TaxID=3366185 RepID=UPI0036B52FAA